MKRRRTAARWLSSDLPDVWRVFDDAAALTAAASELERAGYVSVSDSWAGGSFADAVRVISCGDLSAVPEASKSADLINDAIDLAGVRSEWSPDVVGAFPSVPAYLAGDPCSMWARSPVQDERGEMTLAVSVSASASVSTEEMRRRGVCVLAAVLALSRIRSVRLVVYSSMRLAPVGVRLSFPLDISEVCAFVTRPEVMRRVFMAFGMEANSKAGSSSVGWCKWSEATCGTTATETAAVRDGFGIDGPLVVLTPHKLGSWADLTDGQFVDRLNAMIGKVANGAGDFGDF